jgi:uncharacterized protein YkwD
MAKNKSRWFGDRIMFNYYIRTIALLLLVACQKQSPIQQSIIEENTSPQNNIPIISNAAVEKHNNLRQKHFSNSKLIYSLELEAAAQEYANKLANNGTFTHDPNNLANKYGENLFRFSSTKKPDYSDIIQKWYDEEKYYNHVTKECALGQVCGHYTQIIWQSTKLLGCASAKYTKGSYKNGYVTLCKYYPYGNIIGKSPY